MLTRYKGKTALKSWGQKIAKRWYKKAVVAMASKLAVIMHGTWRDRTVYADRQHADDMSDAAPTAKDRSFWAPRHGLRRTLQPQVGARLSASRRSPGG